MKDSAEALGAGHKGHGGHGGKKGGKHKPHTIHLKQAATGHMLATHEYHPDEDGQMPEDQGQEHVIENTPEAIGAHAHSYMNEGQAPEPPAE